MLASLHPRLRQFHCLQEIFRKCLSGFFKEIGLKVFQKQMFPAAAKECKMDAKDLKETTMDPKSRKLIRVNIDEDEPGETGSLVEQLMGKKPELRFQYIQENAKFVEELDV